MTTVLGIDSGSVSVKVVVADGEGDLLYSRYERHGGRPLEKAREVLADALARHPGTPGVATGSSGRALARALGIEHVNELSAFARSVGCCHPEVRTVFEMGGEDSKLLFLEQGRIRDFALNSVCAAGTGSFLDQQAERMELTPEGFAELSLESEHPPHIAGRCSVFAKSDMIHLQQIATPLKDIAAGLCFSVARNFRGAIVRGRRLRPRVAFMGGVALNRGVVRAFRELFDLPELVVPDNATQMGALGAALAGHDESLAAPLDLDRLAARLRRDPEGLAARAPLRTRADAFAERHLAREEPMAAHGGTLEAYLGIDVGSISTNLAVVDEAGNVAAKRYLRTASKPIEAVRRGLREIGAELAENYGEVAIRGVGTTGSGRYMIADFVRADVVKNEITAQATAASFIDPKVDTVFEIGGQDSKYIRLKDGIIADFEMNKACAAGTGSFLEEQAEKLGIAVKDEFAERALGARAPCRLGERCTVFMENSLMSGLAGGADMDDLLAGLAYSIVENYIGRVVAGRSVGERVFFQGGTAFNHAVTAAFEKHLGIEVVVPPHHDVTGAIGMGLIARDHMRDTGGESAFLGFDLGTRSYEVSSFGCKGCENLCEINKVVIQGSDSPLFYGGRCEKYDIRRRPEDAPEDLFAFREAALCRAHQAFLERFESGEREARRGRMGLPRVFFMHDYLPYFATLLWELGFEVVLSPPTSRAVVELGVEALPADTCFPVKAALGHVKHLLHRGVARQFVPSVVNVAQPEDAWTSSLACPLTQSFPYQARSAMPEADIAAPVVDLHLGQKPLVKELLAVLAPWQVGRKELVRAMHRAAAAQAEFSEAVKARGRQFLAGLDEPAMVVVGRAYNAFDSGMNLDIPRKLAALGVPSIPMDFLDLPDVSRTWPGLYWRSGQRIVAAARFVRAHPRLHPLFLGNFSCGPDSFILKFFDEEMAGEPALHVEIDEHSADAGVVTRLEAFLDSLQSRERGGMGKEGGARAPRPVSRRGFVRSQDTARERTVYLPRMSDHAYALAGAFRGCKVAAEVLPETDDEAVSLARNYVSGKECYPCAVTTGDMLKLAFSRGFDRRRAAFFMPGGTGPCRFGQYNVFQRMVLDKAGFEDVPLFSPVQDASMYEQLGIAGRDFSTRAWQGIAAVTLLEKCLHETRPLEREAGASDALYARWLSRIAAAVEQGNGRLARDLPEMRRDFEAVSRTDENRPLIGIVGEIFVRSNRFSNENLVKKVEELGGRAWLAPVDEWVLYVGNRSRARARRHWDLSAWLKLVLKRHVQYRVLEAYEHPFEDFLETGAEIAVRDVLAKARPYLPESFEGEAVLSMGKAVDMAEKRVAGVINAMPFGCMPGTVTQALLSRVGERFDVPVISLSYDGTASATNRLTLEAFMQQARERAG